MRFAFNTTAQFLRAGIVLLLTSALLVTPLHAQDAAERPPVKRVVVYDTGVAFIEHEGKVSGAKELTLDLPDRDVNDLLKSMVVQDLGGGRISWAALPTSASNSSPIFLGKQKDLAEILSELRGMRIRIGAAAPVEGELVLVENRTIEATKEIIPQATILTSAGVVRVDVKNGDAVQLIDEGQRRAIASSAASMNPAANLSATRIRLRCEGEGDRQVRVGYVAETPIWKTSYRLVLKDGKSLLQAWALVENATQSDWNNVECVLISGRNLGFQTDLRTPLTIKRPYRAPQRYAAIAPQAHRPAEDKPLQRQPDYAASESHDHTNSLDFDPIASGGMGGMGGMGMGGMGGMPYNPRPTSTSTEMSDLLNRRLQLWKSQGAKNSSIAQGTIEGVASASSGAGELVRYQLKGDVSVAKGETALLHLLDAELDGREISIFNPSVDARHPLTGIYASNPTKGALAAGPVSIFSDDAFRGDALIDLWPAGTSRLLSYAIDTQVNIRFESEQKPLEYVGAFVSEKDELIFVAREYLQGAYVVENRSDAKKTIWIEHPRFHDWTLTAPEKVAETADDRYRIETVLEPQREAHAPVALTRYRLFWPQEVSWRLSDKELAALPFATPAMVNMIRLGKDYDKYLMDAEDRYHKVQAQRESLVSDQERLLESVKQLEKFPDQAKRFVDKLVSIETKLEELQVEYEALDAYFDPDYGAKEIESEETKTYHLEQKKLIPQLKAELPIEKLPYKPSERDIETWRSRIQFGSPFGAGGGMGGMGMGGAAFF